MRDTKPRDVFVIVISLSLQIWFLFSWYCFRLNDTSFSSKINGHTIIFHTNLLFSVAEAYFPYSLNININEAVKDFAPDLTEEEVNSISESIFKEYDYSKIYDTIESYIIQFAEDNDLTYEVEELEELNEIDQPEYK